MEQTTKTIPVADLEHLCQAVLRKCGLSDADARIAADVLVTTDTYGVYTHGVKCVAGYVSRLKAGGLKADAVPRIEREGPGWAIVDGQSALAHGDFRVCHEHRHREGQENGHCVRGRAKQLPLRSGRLLRQPGRQGRHDRSGHGQRHSQHGYARRLKPVLGTNPFSYAVPAGDEDPIFLDIASSAVAIGKIRIAKALGQKVPDTWLVDSEGMPTTDATAYPHAAAPQPFAGHKGYGIALMIEVLAGLLSGGSIRWGVESWTDADPSLPTHHGGAFIAIDVGQIIPLTSSRIAWTP